MDQPSYLKWSNAAMISVVFAALLGLGILVFYHVEDVRLKAENQTALKALVATKQAQLNAWFEDEIEDANLIVHEKRFINIIEAYMKGEGDSSPVLDMLHQTKKEHMYADLILLDTLGNHHLSTNPALAFNDSIDKIYYAKARMTDSSMVSELYRSTIDSRVYIDVIAAIKNLMGDNMGGIVFKISPERTLVPILSDWEIEGGRFHFSLAWNDRQDSWLIYSPHTDRPDTGSCWVPLTTAQRALITNDDHFHISQIQHVPWLLLVELDDTQRTNNLRSFLHLMLFIAAILVLLCFLAVYFIIHFRQGKNMYAYLEQGAELASLKQRFRLTLDVLQEAVVLTNHDGSILYINLMGESLLGVKLEAVSGKMVDDVVRLTRPGTGVPLFNVIGWLQGDKAMTRFESAWLTNQAGNTITVSCTLTYLPSTSPMSEGLLLTIKDETAVYTQQQLTQENENRFRQLFQDAPDAFLLVDAEGCIRLANVMAVSMFGYTPEVLLTMRVVDLVPATQVDLMADFKTYFNQPGKKIMGQGQPIQGMRKDGRLFEALVTLSPVMDRDVMLAMVVVRDVTDIVEKEARLRLNASIIDNMREGVILFALKDYKVLFTNPRLRDLFGYTEAEMEVIGIKDLLADDEPYVGYLRHNMNFIQPETLNVEHSLHCVNRSGELFHVTAHIYTFEYGTQGTVLIAVLQKLSK